MKFEEKWKNKLTVGSIEIKKQVLYA